MSDFLNNIHDGVTNHPIYVFTGIIALLVSLTGYIWKGHKFCKLTWNKFSNWLTERRKKKYKELVKPIISELLDEIRDLSNNKKNDGFSPDLQKRIERLDKAFSNFSKILTEAVNRYHTMEEYPNNYYHKNEWRAKSGDLGLPILELLKECPQDGELHDLEPIEWINDRELFKGKMNYIRNNASTWAKNDREALLKSNN